MGGGGSKVQWEGYTAALFKDTKQQTIEVEDSEEKGATAIRRHPDAKDGFVGFMTDSESKTEMDSGWQCIKVALNKYKDQKCFGYRPFTEPEKDPLQRGTYKFDTYESIKKQIYSCANGMFQAYSPSFPPFHIHA